MDYEAILQKKIAAYEYHMRRLGCGVCKLNYHLDHYCKDFEKDELVQSCSELALLLQSLNILVLDKRDYFLLSANLLFRLTPNFNKSGRFDYVRLIESNEIAISEETFREVIQAITPSFEEIETCEPPTLDPELSPSSGEDCNIQLLKTRIELEALRPLPQWTSSWFDQNLRLSNNVQTPLTFALAASPVMERCVGFGCPGPPIANLVHWIV